MRKKIEDQSLIPTYPITEEWNPLTYSLTNPGLPNPAGGPRIFLAGDITIKNQWKFLDDRDRFARRNNDPAPNMEELLNELDQYPENVWNIEWLQKNDPKIDAYETDKWYFYESNYQIPGNSNYRSGTVMPYNMFPWNGRAKTNGFNPDEALGFQPSISNIQPWTKVDYESKEFTLNDIPYLIDQVPELAIPPYSDKELIITNLRL